MSPTNNMKVCRCNEEYVVCERHPKPMPTIENKECCWECKNTDPNRGIVCTNYGCKCHWTKKCCGDNKHICGTHVASHHGKDIYCSNFVPCGVHGKKECWKYHPVGVLCEHCSTPEKKRESWEEEFDQIFDPKNKSPLMRSIAELTKKLFFTFLESERREERNRILNIINDVIDKNDDGMWYGREILDGLVEIINSKK
jgi:hypothetical protein